MRNNTNGKDRNNYSGNKGRDNYSNNSSRGNYSNNKERDSELSNKELLQKIDRLTEELNMLRPTCTVELSVIVNVNDNCQRIADCLDTLVNQTYSKFEIVCMYSGSDDDMYNTLRSYQTDHKNLVIYSVDTVIGSEIFKKALSVCRGRYVMYVSPFEWLASEHTVADIMETLNSSVCDVLKGNTLLYKKAPDSEKEICKDALSSCVISKRYAEEKITRLGDMKHYYRQLLYTVVYNEATKKLETDNVFCYRRNCPIENASVEHSNLFVNYPVDRPDVINELLESGIFLMKYFLKKSAYSNYAEAYMNIAENWSDVIASYVDESNEKLAGYLYEVNELFDKKIINEQNYDCVDGDIYLRIIEKLKKRM